jgi:hypothetical protein
MAGSTLVEFAALIIFVAVFVHGARITFGIAIFRTSRRLFIGIAGVVATRWCTVFVAVDGGFPLVTVAVATVSGRRWAVTVFRAVTGVLAGLAFAIATFGGLSASKAIFVCGTFGNVVECILQPTRRVVDAIVFTLFFALAIRDALNVTFAEVAVETLIAHVAVVDNALKGVAGRRRPFAVIGAVVRVFTVFTFAVSTFGCGSASR